MAQISGSLAARAYNSPANDPTLHKTVQANAPARAPSPKKPVARRKQAAAKNAKAAAKRPVQIYAGLAPWPPPEDEVPRFVGIGNEGKPSDAGGCRNWPLVDETEPLVLMRHDTKGMGIFAVGRIKKGATILPCKLGALRKMTPEDMEVATPAQGSKLQADQLYGVCAPKPLALTAFGVRDRRVGSRRLQEHATDNGAERGPPEREVTRSMLRYRRTRGLLRAGP